ncbi:Hypothetical protein NTJ_01780 [Nesidiocoris tenuis]|uniref:Uncharacterized protein n=1 Tax=Nesidiocoris tenuis TaxID=355587 RepID=A0ABN7AAF2_9HEMI|nr:Hypothetical protein NTJ_01780 [Nesidiocoris tenuis]
MEETYKQRKQREERERQFQRKKRLENARRVYLDFINDPKAFNLGVKYSMIDQMSEELAQYLDMVDCRRILTGMLEFVYDPSTRPEDPVDYFASLTKDRKIDKRELNKARRYLYQLMWKEYEIREEIEKLKTLLNLTSPRDYKPDGTERTEEEKAKYDLARRRYSSMQRDLLIRTESLKSLMSHRDEKIPTVFGSYSIPAPEPVAISGKDIMEERTDVEKGRKKKGTRARSRSRASKTSKGRISKASRGRASRTSRSTSKEEARKTSIKSEGNKSTKGSLVGSEEGPTRKSSKRSPKSRKGSSGRSKKKSKKSKGKSSSRSAKSKRKSSKRSKKGASKKKA